MTALRADVTSSDHVSLPLHSVSERSCTPDDHRHKTTPAIRSRFAPSSRGPSRTRTRAYRPQGCSQELLHSGCIFFLLWIHSSDSSRGQYSVVLLGYRAGEHPGAFIVQIGFPDRFSDLVDIHHRGNRPCSAMKSCSIGPTSVDLYSRPFTFSATHLTRSMR